MKCGFSAKQILRLNLKTFSSSEKEGFNIVEGSVVNENTVQKAVEGVDVVYHLAAAQHEAGKSDQHFHDVNVVGTRNMLQASRAAAAKRFVHGSTIGVYDAGSGTVRDDSPTVPDNIYGTTKLEAERVVSSFQEKLPVVTIRISETYGPGDRRLLKLFRGVQKGKYFHIGRSNNLHHPVYVDDLVAALQLAAQKDRACGQTLVVPGFEALTTREMVTKIAKVLEVKPPGLTVPLWPFGRSRRLWNGRCVRSAFNRRFTAGECTFLRRALSFPARRRARSWTISPESALRKARSVPRNGIGKRACSPSRNRHHGVSDSKHVWNLRNRCA